MVQPLPLSEIFDHLPIASVEWTIQRNDELSMTGAGEVFQADLSDALWTAPVTLGPGTHAELKQAAALIRSLQGAAIPFMMCDPTSLWPQTDPGGLMLGSRDVRIDALLGTRAMARFNGLPVNYQLRPGEKFQITVGDRHTFHEVSRITSAGAGGVIDVACFPWLPLDLQVNAVVTLIRPACPVAIQKDTHRPGTARRHTTDNASFTVVQRRRR